MVRVLGPCGGVDLLREPGAAALRSGAPAETGRPRGQGAPCSASSILLCPWSSPSFPRRPTALSRWPAAAGWRSAPGPAPRCGAGQGAWDQPCPSAWPATGHEGLCRRKGRGGGFVDLGPCAQALAGCRVSSWLLVSSKRGWGCLFSTPRPWQLTPGLPATAEATASVQVQEECDCKWLVGEGDHWGKKKEREMAQPVTPIPTGSRGAFYCSLPDAGGDGGEAGQQDHVDGAEEAQGFGAREVGCSEHLRLALAECPPHSRDWTRSCWGPRRTLSAQGAVSTCPWWYPGR